MFIKIDLIKPYNYIAMTSGNYAIFHILIFVELLLGGLNLSERNTTAGLLYIALLFIDLITLILITMIAIPIYEMMTVRSILITNTVIILANIMAIVFSGYLHIHFGDHIIYNLTCFMASTTLFAIVNIICVLLSIYLQIKNNIRTNTVNNAL